MTDYIIVGCGLAGIAFAETALANDKSILVFENNSQTSSRVAGGLYNPVILKRFSGLADAQEQLNKMNAFYESLLSRIPLKVNHAMPVLRKFYSVEELNNWFIAADKPSLQEFLSTRVVSTRYSGIESPLGFGEVLQTGYVDTAKLLELYHVFLRNEGLLVEAPFNYGALALGEDKVVYGEVAARNIVFAEGFGIHSNPFFSYLPLNGTKGELFIIKAPDLNLDVIVNTSVFILPLGNSLFKVGATYEWVDKTDLPTEAGKQELIARIKEILECDFEVIQHLAGVRPTTKDRKAILGTHPNHKQLHVLNGLGTRGVMLAPAMAQTLFDHIEEGEPIKREISINRFSPQDRASCRSS
ncbi:MAG TPA: FAD-binding oxidoreductase [Flavobacterium sp.]|jgi:glycine/D-amino acid oxidase-like deaminating enzyme